MTADMAAVERMLKADSKKGRGSAQIGASGDGGSGFNWKDADEDKGHPGDAHEQSKRPEAGSQEELQFMMAAWADPEFRKAFYAQYGEQLEAQGIKCDGTFPGNVALGGGILPGKGQDGPRGLTITPEPGFVIKTRTLETNEKVFINFCKSPKVRSFSREPDPNDATVERVRIPLSLGPARNDLDKSGEPCVVYDVVFNTEVMEQAQHAKEFKEFLVSLGMSWVMEKGGGGLDVKNHSEVKLRGNYKGKFPVMQTVRAEALIEELEPVDEGGTSDFGAGMASAFPHPSTFSATRAAAENSNYADSFRGADGFHKEGKLPGYAKVEESPAMEQIETPERRLYVDVEGGQQWAFQPGKAYEGEIQAFVVKVELPRMDTAAEADLDLTATSLSLDVEDKYELDLDLPWPIDDGAADAAWDRHKRVLTLTLPLKSWTEKAYAKHRAAIAAAAPAVAGAEEQQGEVEEEQQGEVEDPAPGNDARAGVGAGKVAGEQRVEAEDKKGGASGKSGSKGSGFCFSRKDSKAGAAPEAATGEVGGGSDGGGGAKGMGDKGKGEGKTSQVTEFEATLKDKLRKQAAVAEAAAHKGAPRPIRGSKEEQERKALAANGPTVSNRLPFSCERCNWGSRATAIRKCRRCGWCEPGSKEETEAWEQAKEHEKFRASRKEDEVGAVDENGGVEEEGSVRAFAFACRAAYQLDDDTPGWLEAIREKHYGGAKEDKNKSVAGRVEGVGEEEEESKEERRKREEQERVMPLAVKGLPTIEPLD